jgi:hypothetical protein
MPALQNRRLTTVKPLILLIAMKVSLSAHRHELLLFSH